MHWLARPRSFHDLTVADVNNDMLYWLIEKEQVARLQLAQAYLVAGGGLRGGSARQPDTDLVIGPLHQTTAVKSTRRVTTVNVWRALLSECDGNSTGRRAQLYGGVRRGRCHCCRSRGNCLGRDSFRLRDRRRGFRPNRGINALCHRGSGWSSACGCRHPATGYLQLLARGEDSRISDRLSTALIQALPTRHGITSEGLRCRMSRR